MLTRFIKTQLIIFTIASIVGVTVMLLVYIQAPTLLNINRLVVKLELPATGGLYKFSNVTYRGVQIGKVTDVRATRAGAEATLSLDNSPQIPANLTAKVLSVSAVGEQYVDLLPESDSGPYLTDGSVIPAKRTVLPQAVGPMLDQVSVLLDTIPKDRLRNLLDSAFKGLNGTGYDFQTLMDSASKLVGDFNGVADQSKALVDQMGPLLDGQVASTDAVRTWARSLAGISEQVATDDPQVRTLLQNGPGAADEATALFSQLKPTLPVLLANLRALGQIAVTYNPALEQMLVLFPPFVGATQTQGLPSHNPTGMTMGDFTIVNDDPPACNVGFLPPSSWRSPNDLSDVDTPNGLYCKLPQDSPIGVRGARNYPCLNKPGKRAPTVEICESDLPYEPLAMRQHATGPNPIDPNLVAQGIPLDDRVTLNDHIYGPLQGTPMPPGPVPPGPAPEAPAPAPAAPVPDNGVPPAPGTPVVAPSGYAAGQAPAVESATYDPQTGQYATPNGGVFWQSDLAKSSGAGPTAEKSWKDLLPTA
jgi:virulence factor Mce-like protein